MDGCRLLYLSLRGARKGDVAISARETRRLLRFARNDIKLDRFNIHISCHERENLLSLSLIVE